MWVRAAVSVVLLAIVLASAGVGEVLDRLRGGDLWLLVPSTACLVAAFLVGAERWRRFLRAAGVDRPYGAVLRVTFVGAFATNLLPGTVGGDAARAWLVGPGRRVQGLATVLVDRLSLFGCSVALGWIALVSAGAPHELVVALCLATVVVAVAGLVLTGAVGVGGRLGGRAETRLGVALGSLAAAARDCVRSGRVLVVATALGLAYQALVVLEVWLLAEAISLDLSYATLAVVTPPVLLLSVLPLGIGGFGIREVSYVALLAAVGVGAADATVLSLLAGTVYVLASLPGAVGLVSDATLADAAATAAPAEPAVTRPS